MIFCSACGSKNASEMEVCSACGVELKAHDTTISMHPVVEETIRDLNIVVKPSKKAQIVVIKGPNLGEHFLINEGDNNIGRDPESDIFLNDVTVSRKHAVLTKKKVNYSVKDTGSLNGTYLNDSRLDSFELSDGDQIQVGKYRFLFIGGK